MKAGNIHYEMAEKARAVNCGGIGAIHLMVNKLGDMSRLVRTWGGYGGRAEHAKSAETLSSVSSTSFIGGYDNL